MKPRKNHQVIFTHITAGLQLGITIFIFVYAGYRLDLYFEKSPLFVVIGTAFGMVTGFYHLMKELQKETSSDETNGDDKDKENSAPWL